VYIDSEEEILQVRALASSEVEWDYDVMELKLIDASRDRRIGGPTQRLQPRIVRD
jgi:hypothetical protein